VKTRDELIKALAAARTADRTSVIVIETDMNQRVAGYESWWDVPIAETSQIESVRAARQEYEKALQKEHHFLGPGGKKSGKLR
jgi:3D-(3,5/4)-trihydroxycyclohexane-1,2-dione acylhydrolase (decyclizing)